MLNTHAALFLPNYAATCWIVLPRSRPRQNATAAAGWGISESCYSQLDSLKAYQYRAFMSWTGTR
jgi:hypothetical protein